EQTRAEDDQDQAQEERDLPGEEGRRADRYVPQRDQQRTPPDRAPQTEQPVGYPAARERGQVNAEPVDPDDRRRLVPVEPEPAFRQRRSHEEDEERSQAGVREPLPHFREEQRRQARRRAENPPSALGRLQTGARLVLRDGAGPRPPAHGS